jgi:hypothetical protein
MRDEDIKRLSEPYENERIDVDRRFHSAIGADVPHAVVLVREILSDFDRSTVGIPWWSSTPVHERALIGDYLYQCAFGIEVNLAEAKLHYMEFRDAREKHDKRIENSVFIGPDGEPAFKHPPSVAPIDDLINKLEGMHVCGFFQSIGSTLDCLGAAIIGVLGLPRKLRKSDIAKAEDALNKLQSTGTPGNKMQLEFKTFFDSVKTTSGVPGWLEWSDQYRNTFIHRGRRYTFNQITPRPSLVLDKDGRTRPITTSTMHLVREPDKSDAEGFMHGNVVLNEDADVTLSGIFKSCRDMEEAICERLVEIWRQRRADPSLIEQPVTQWDSTFKSCSFTGYDPNAEPIEKDVVVGSGVMLERMISSGTVDSRLAMWKNSPWDK